MMFSIKHDCDLPVSGACKFNAQMMNQALTIQLVVSHLKIILMLAGMHEWWRNILALISLNYKFFMTPTSPCKSS